MFTRETANALLPELTKRLEGLREAFRVAKNQSEQVEEASKGNGGTSGAGELLKATHVIASTLEWLQDRGILVRDVEEGLVDFPSTRNGDDVFLCWKLGEPAVDYWHDLDTGFAGRRSLDE